MRLTFLLFLCTSLPGVVFAGAWPREQNRYFVALGGNFLLSDGAQLPVHYDPTVYLEYGLRPDVTLGFAYHKADQDRVDQTILFARFPFGTNAGVDRFAASMGLGMRSESDTPNENLVQGGLYWGRGFEQGWFAIDYTTTYGDKNRSWRSKADFTWGQTIAPRWTAFFQMQIGDGLGGDFYAKVNPAIVYRINDANRVSLGAVKALTGDEGSALKLDLWTEF